MPDQSPDTPVRLAMPRHRTPLEKATRNHRVRLGIATPVTVAEWAQAPREFTEDRERHYLVPVHGAEVSVTVPMLHAPAEYGWPCP